MADDLSALTWAERAHRDPTLRAFVDAELARGGVELDTLRYQHAVDRQRIATLIAQLDAAEGVIKTLRRQRGRGTRLTEESSHDAA